MDLNPGQALGLTLVAFIIFSLLFSIVMVQIKKWRMMPEEREEYETAKALGEFDEWGA